MRDAEDQCVLCFDAPKDHIILPDSYDYPRALPPLKSLLFLLEDAQAAGWGSTVRWEDAPISPSAGTHPGLARLPRPGAPGSRLILHDDNSDE